MPNRCDFKRTVRVDKTSIGDGSPVYVEVDLGAKYYPLSIMKKMIQAAKDAGVNAVKIQTYKPETTTLRLGSFYRGQGKRKEDQYSFFSKYQLSPQDHFKLFKYAKDIGVTMFATPCHQRDVDFLEKLDVPAYKIASGWATNIPFIEYVARKGRPIILSTGMTTLGEIHEAVETIRKTGNTQLVLLHCVVDYPAKVEDSNLRVIDTLRSAFACPVGFSDHTDGIIAPFLAASRGANYIEKHFILDKSLKGPDSEPALEPKELAQLVKTVRLIDTVLGTGERYIFPAEEKWAKPGRQSIVSVQEIKKGEKIAMEMIDIMRPSGGLPPNRWYSLIGGRALQNIPKYSLIKEGMILPK